MQGRPMLTITVKDSSGASIPHAKVQLLFLEGEYGYQAETDPKGNAVLMPVSGRYGITISAPGFINAMERISVGTQNRSEEIVLSANGIRRDDIGGQVREMPLASSPELRHEVASTDLTRDMQAESARQLFVVRVVVTDATGSPIPQASVLAMPIADNTPSQGWSGPGGYTYLALAPGEYELTITAQAFRQERKKIVISRNEQVVPITLTVGGGSHVEVTEVIEPTRAIPSGKAPAMRVKLVESVGGEKVYAVVFRKGDEMLSGLTDFAKRYHVVDAHFTGIGAVSGATVGWLDLSRKNYNPIHVEEQVEVLAMTGDIATFNGNPVVHAHLVLGRRDGSTVGGHMWEAHVNPTVEVFVTTHETKLDKVPDDSSGMKLIDPSK
jgi:predicted DNA-binding protein with PD1-like motif